MVCIELSDYLHLRYFLQRFCEDIPFFFHIQLRVHHKSYLILQLLHLLFDFILLVFSLLQSSIFLAHSRFHLCEWVTSVRSDQLRRVNDLIFSRKVTISLLHFLQYLFCVLDFWTVLFSTDLLHYLFIFKNKMLIQKISSIFTVNWRWWNFNRFLRYFIWLVLSF